MAVYIEPFRDYDDKGKSLHEFYVVFGEVNSAEL
jgi:hypothetical protein